jgi:hypothetical protein
MLFLAVFCGYLAEYQLEHKIEKDRERKYIRSLIEDLRTDTSGLRRFIRQENSLILYGDSLIQLLQSGEYKKNGSRTYYTARRMFLGGPFLNADGTLSQLKNAGGFRLIKKKDVIDSIVAYDIAIHALNALDDINKEGRISFAEISGEVLNTSILYAMTDSLRNITAPPGNPALFNDSPLALNKMIGNAASLVNASRGKKLMAGRLIYRAERLINFLRVEYNYQ